jgi:hypothetical protein
LGTVLGSGAAAAALLVPAVAFANLPAPAQPGASPEPTIALLNPAPAFEIDRQDLQVQVQQAKSSAARLEANGPTPQDLTVLRPMRVSAAAAAGDVNVSYGDITTTTDYTPGVSTTSTGDTVITAGNITTSGAYSDGVTANGSGKISITTGNVNTSGINSTGIAATGGGDVKITTGNVTTSGYRAYGISAHSTGGSVTIQAQDVVTQGNASGIVATAHGDVTVNAHSVGTYGSGSTGIAATGGGDVKITVGNVATYGYFSYGINASSTGGSLTIQAQEVATQGYAFAPGILASAHGDVTVTAGAVNTQGVLSNGISAGSQTGKVTVTAGTVLTTGAAGSYGIAAGGQSVEVTLNQSLVTYGYLSPGIKALTGGAGDAIIHDKGSVTTHGAYSPAVYANVGISQLGQPAHGDVKIDGGGNVTTYGYFSAGIVGGNSAGGSVSITAGTVETHGSGSGAVNGITLDFTESHKVGNVTIDVQSATTTGDYSQAIFARIGAEPVYSFAGGGGGQIDITVHDSASTRGYHSNTITVLGFNNNANVNVANNLTTRASESNGVFAFGENLTVDVGGTISTHGDRSRGVFAYAGGDIHITTGTVQTAGDYADGIVALAPSAGGGGRYCTQLISCTAAGGAVAINANRITTAGKKSFGIYAFGGAGVTINAGSIATQGDEAAALVAKAYNGPLSITETGSITTQGKQAPGVYALGSHGPVNLTLTGAISTKGDQSTGVQAFGGGDISLQVGSVSTAGADAKAIYANGAGSGTVTLGVSGKVASSGANGVVLVNTGGATNITVASTGSVVGAGDAIQVQSGGGPVTVSNAGTITGGAGYAIAVTGLPNTAATASAQINNTGTLVGAVNLAGGGAKLTNAGTFVATKDSDFGGGGSQFVNTGVLKIASGAAGAVSFQNLATFQNAGGLIELRNGHAGDVFTLSGDYVASGNARLGLDVNGTTADKLVIAGTASGATSVLLTGNPAAASLLAKPMNLVQAGAGSTGTFTLANPNVGLIHYGLQPDAASAARAGVSMAAAAAAPVSYSLTASAGAPVYGTLKLEENVQNIWRQSADAWSEHLAAMRGDAWGGGKGQGASSGYGLGSGRYWVQAYGSTGDRNQTVGGFSTSYNQTDAGVQAGADLVRTATRLGEVGWGVTAGYTNSQIDSQGGTLKSDVDTFNFGGYAVLNHGPYFANGLVKFDHHQISTSDSVAGYSANLSGNSYGAQFEVGRRFGTERFAFEPTVSLTYVRTSLDNASIYGQTLAFDDEDGVSGKIGGRFYSNHTFANGTTAVFYAGAAAVDDFTGGQKATFYSGGTSQNVSAGGEGAYGQAVLGVSGRATRNLTLYLQGDANFGGSRSGAGVRFGARF